MVLLSIEGIGHGEKYNIRLEDVEEMRIGRLDSGSELAKILKELKIYNGSSVYIVSKVKLNSHLKSAFRTSNTINIGKYELRFINGHGNKPQIILLKEESGILFRTGKIIMIIDTGIHDLTVSRDHVLIIRQGNSLIIKDHGKGLGSKNGTIVYKKQGNSIQMIADLKGGKHIEIRENGKYLIEIGSKTYIPIILH